MSSSSVSQKKGRMVSISEAVYVTDGTFSKTSPHTKREKIPILLSVLGLENEEELREKYPQIKITQRKRTPQEMVTTEDVANNVGVSSTLVRRWIRGAAPIPRRRLPALILALRVANEEELQRKYPKMTLPEKKQTRREMAAIVGISYGLLNKWLHSATPVPRARVVALMTVLEVTSEQELQKKYPKVFIREEGKTQSEIAKELGVSRSLVNKWMYGLTHVPRARVAKLMSALGFTNEQELREKHPKIKLREERR